MKILQGEMDAHLVPDKIIQPDDSLFIKPKNSAQIFTPVLAVPVVYAES